MKKPFIAILTALFTISLANAQDIVGDWHGTLKAGPAELRLALHVTKTGSDLHATVDSVDQGANGIPVTSISLKDSKLTLTLDSIKGSYEGQVASGGKSIDGTWTQGPQSFPLTFEPGGIAKVTHKPAKPSDIDGAWAGVLNVGGQTLHVIFHIVNTEDGLTATLDSPDQGGAGVPATSVSRTGSTLKVEVKPIGGAFEGAISKDLAAIDGTWTQGPASLPLVLKRAKE